MPSGLRIRSRHIEAPERMHADERPSDLPVDVEIADVERLLRLFHPLPVFRPHSACQTEFGVVRDLEGLIEIIRLDDSEYGTEDLFLSNRRLGTDIGDHRRTDEITIPRRLCATRHKLSPFLHTPLNVRKDLFLRPLVDDGTKVVRGIV